MRVFETKEEVILKEPFLALCTDRTKSPKTNIKYGCPEYWLSNSNLTNKNLFGITFDFFIDWTSNSCSNEVWIKKILSENYNYDYLIENHIKIFTDSFEPNYFKYLSAFSDFYNIKPCFIIYNDNQDWSNDDSLLLKVYISDKKEQEGLGKLVTFSKIKLTDFKREIRIKSGGCIRIGNKGLIFGTSSLECALSKTDSPYAGDVDLVIIKPTGELECILEYKKHNQDTPIKLQKLSNYYPSRDGRKYNRLAILRDFLNEKLPILNIYYPTKPNFSEGRLELLKGLNNNLSTNVASNFSLEEVKENPIFLLDKILKAVKYHNNLSNIKS